MNFLTIESTVSFNDIKWVISSITIGHVIIWIMHYLYTQKNLPKPSYLLGHICILGPIVYAPQKWSLVPCHNQWDYFTGSKYIITLLPALFAYTCTCTYQTLNFTGEKSNVVMTTTILPIWRTEILVIAILTLFVTNEVYQFWLFYHLHTRYMTYRM